MKFSTATVWTLSSLLTVQGLKLDEPSFSPVEMAVTANNLATDAAKRMLAKGGTVVDAMIAAQSVLSLVEPQSSGIGGGAFCVLYMDGKLTTFDAREKAPSQATEQRFQHANGTSIEFFDAWQSGLSVGVPGIPKLMDKLHARHGKVDWAELFQDAKNLAVNGYEQTGRTVNCANKKFVDNPSCEDRMFFRDDTTFEYFYDTDGKTCAPKAEGTTMYNPEYADTLDLLIDGGADAFYTGTLAEDIVTKVKADRNPTGDATISMEDLANYDIRERSPVCKIYRKDYDVCGMGPPSSGALAIGQILGVLENYDLTLNDRQSVETVHLFTQAMRLAFADRNKYVADSDFVTVPVEGMLDEAYLAERAKLIDTTKDMGKAEPGVPPGDFDPNAAQTINPESGTSHLSLIDQYGNALSMTTTVESYFGSGLMVGGFLLNNQMTDFSFENVGEDGQPIANRVEANKRPRSSMSPSMVFDKSSGELTYLAGSPGGSRIIGYTSQVLVAMLDYGVNPQVAVNTPHYQNRNGKTELEPTIDGVTSDYDFEALKEELEALGHAVVSIAGEESGLSVIQVTEDGYLGGADPRRDGTAGGRASLEEKPEELKAPVDEEEAGLHDSGATTSSFFVATFVVGMVAALL